jgi:hypothetical protein
MRSLINLHATLSDSDPGWLTFGLDMPSTDTTPGQPENVIVTVDDTGALLVVQCDSLARAVRFRWRMLLVGVETDYRLVARSVAPLATIADVLPGQTVEIVAQGVNFAGSQGVASEPVRFTMPLVPRTKTPEAVAPVLSEPAVSAERSGSNGHSNGSRLPALA